MATPMLAAVAADDGDDDVRLQDAAREFYEAGVTDYHEAAAKALEKYGLALLPDDVALRVVAQEFKTRFRQFRNETLRESTPPVANVGPSRSRLATETGIDIWGVPWRVKRDGEWVAVSTSDLTLTEVAQLKLSYGKLRERAAVREEWCSMLLELGLAHRVLRIGELRDLGVELPPFPGQDSL